MTLPASGELGIIEIFEEIFPVSHTTEVLSLVDLYDFSGLTPKTDNIAISDFYSYTLIPNIIITETEIEITFQATTWLAVTKLTANDDWAVTLSPSWITVISPDNDTFSYKADIAITVEENEGFDRVGTITFKLDSHSNFVQFEVTQLENPLS